MKKAWLFYLLSCTWGLPMTLCGALVIGILRLCGHPVRRFGVCRYIEIGERWGGLELGIFFLKDRNSSVHICIHESGHAVQNILYGPLMPFLVSIPSAIRYHIRRIAIRRGYRPRRHYEDIWFERQATAWGMKYFGNPEQPREQSSPHSV